VRNEISNVYFASIYFKKTILINLTLNLEGEVRGEGGEVT
jgi:hypothetical protein